MKDFIRLGWLVLGFLAFSAVVLPAGSNGQASLMEALVYQLTDASPKSVGGLFD